MKRRKDGRWLKVITINGEKIYFYSSAETEKKAEKEINQKLLDYTQKQENGPKFKTVAEEWLAQKEKEIKETTLKRYKSCYQRSIDEFGNKYIKDITVVNLNNYISQFSLIYPTFKTVAAQKSIISLIFDYACIKGYIQQNPCAFIKISKKLGRTKRLIPTDAEISLIKENKNLSQEGFFAFFLLHTGLRRSEALALTLNDIDFKNNLITINKNLNYAYNTPKLSTTKTESGNRTVVLLAPLKETLLERYSDFINKDCSIKENHKATILFPNKAGNYMPESYFTRRWKKYCETLEIHITPHQLRHAFATMCFDANLSEKDTQELMGHSSIVVTHNIYTHIRQSRIKDAESKLNSFLQNGI